MQLEVNFNEMKRRRPLNTKRESGRYKKQHRVVSATSAARSRQLNVVVDFLHVVEIVEMIDEFGNCFHLCGADGDEVFGESSFFPIPPDILLILLVLGASERWLRFALGTTLASVLGGLAGYAIGFFAWQTLGRWLIAHLMHIELVLVDGREDVQRPAYLEKLLDTQPVYLFQTFDNWNAWIVFAFGLVPLPYKLITIAQVNIAVFVLASTLSRGLRFTVLAFLIYRLGPPAKTYIDRHFNVLAIAFTVLLLGGFALCLAGFFRRTSARAVVEQAAHRPRAGNGAAMLCSNRWLQPVS